jgi:hypothetical protein
LPAEQIVDRGRAALVGNGVEIDFGETLEKLTARCVDVPLPAWAKDRLPGLARASAITSATVLNGESARTSRMLGEEANSEIGVKSLNVS